MSASKPLENDSAPTDDAEAVEVFAKARAGDATALDRIPETHVAGLLGHSSTAMLHKHYSHLTSKTDVLRTAAALVRPATT